MKLLSLYYIIFIFCLVQKSAAQFIISGNAGINITHAEIKNPTIYDFSNQTNFYYLGINSTVNISNKWSASLDLDFIQKGYEFSGSVTTKTRYTRLDMGPSINFKLNQNIRFGIGPYFGFGLKEASQDIQGNWQDKYYSNLVKNFDIGAKANLIYSFDRIYFRFAFSKGFTNLSSWTFTDGNGLVLGVGSQRFLDFQIGVGYIFFKGKSDQKVEEN